ncbi:MAG: AAA-like domain-containing protein [Fimbriimonadaceae bacterium]|jgi:WD40 repeat protein|nr:AAA-like domain-containing protein [Fimbriimonadaceae bacterium]
MVLSSDYFSLGGTLPAGSPSYLARRADEDLRTTLLEHRYALVLDSRQKGKSSLLARVAADLRTSGYRVVKLDLQRFGSTLTSDQWYSALLLAAAEQLDLIDEAQRLRKSESHESLAQRFIRFLERCALDSQVGLIIFIDEVDFLRSLPFDTDDFLAIIRSSFQRRSEKSSLRKLVFCFCGASTPTGLVRNASLGEMIVGARTTLEDFSLTELQPYSQQLVNHSQSGELALRRIYFWTSGHPYLTQVACDQWNRQGSNLASIDEFFRKQTKTVGNQHQTDHLVALSRALLNVQLPGLPVEESRVRVLEALSQIFRHRKVPATRFPRPLVDALLICGVVREDGLHLSPRNRIYKKAFDRAWIRDHLPHAERQRQRVAALRAFFVTGGLSVGIIGVLGLLAFQNYGLAERLRGALTQAQMNERDARLEAYVGAMQSVSAEMQDGNMMRAGLVLDSLKNSPFRGWEWHYADRISSTEETSRRFAQPVYTWITDENGRISAAAQGDTTLLLDPSGLITQRIPHGAPLTNPRSLVNLISVLTPEGNLLIRPDGSTQTVGMTILAQTREYSLQWEGAKKRVFLTRSGGSTLSLEPSASIQAGTFSEKLQLVVLRSGSSLTIYDARNGRVLVSLRNFVTVNDFVVDELGGRLYVASDRPEVQAFSLPSGRELPMLLGNEGPVKSLSLSRDGKMLLTGGSDGITRRYSTESGQIESVHYGHQGSVLRVAFGTDDSSFITSSNDNTMKTWRLGQPEVKRVIEIGSSEAPRFKISQWAPVLVSIFEDGFSASAVVDGSSNPVILRQPQGVTMVGRTIVRKSEAVFLRSDGVLRWERAGGPQEFPPKPELAEAVHLASNEDSAIVYVLSQQGAVHEVNLLNSTSRQISPGMGTSARTLAVHGSKLAVGYNDGGLQLLRSETGATIWEGNGKVKVQNIEFSRTGELFAVCLADGRVLLCDGETGATIHTFVGHSSRVWRATFSQDGTMVTTCSFDNSARIWDVSTGRELQRLQMKSWVGDVSFNPDATRVVTACGDGSVRLWSVATGREVLVIHRQREPVFTVRFTPDGNWIVAGTIGGRLLMWNGSPRPTRGSAKSGSQE